MIGLRTSAGPISAGPTLKDRACACPEFKVLKMPLATDSLSDSFLISPSETQNGESQLSAPNRTQRPSPVRRARSWAQLGPRERALLLGLILLGPLLNFLNLPLFFGAVQFLFGSVSALLVLRLFGLKWGTLAAFLASLYTFVLWHHPWFIPLFTLEVWGVGVLMNRRLRGLLLADGVFWLFFGIPLVWLTYTFILQVDPVSIWLIALKDAVNGLLNALVAGLLLIYTPLRRWAGLGEREAPSLSQTLFYLLSAMVLLPALALTLYQSHQALDKSEAETAFAARSTAEVLSGDIRAWHNDHQRDLTTLARLAAPKDQASRPDSLQKAMQLLVGARDFQELAITNAQGRTAEWRSVPTSRHTLALSVPLHTASSSEGRVTGKLDLKPLQGLLSAQMTQRDGCALILDEQNRVLASTNRADILMLPFNRLNADTGRLKSLGGNLFRWEPSGALSVLKRWKKSVFFQKSALPMTASQQWTLLVEAPFEAQQTYLMGVFVYNFAIMLSLSLLALLLATLLSRSLTQPLTQLARVTTGLPAKLLRAKNEPDHDSVVWPRSRVTEMDHLVRNFQAMEGTLKTNIDQIRAAQHDLELESARLGQANRLKDEFLAVLSHELRTPLVPILGYADLMQSGQLDSEEVRQAARVIERNAKAQSALIEDLLDVSRIIAGKMRLKIGDVDLTNLVQDALEAVRFNAESKGVSLRFQAPAEPPRMIGDVPRLRQVVLNLLSNSLKFTPQGGCVNVQLDAIPATDLAGAQARIVVQDNGAGIPPQFLPHVFDRFRQAADHLTRPAGGLGLGLSIVRHLVELHGGRVEAHSEGEGHGATFIVTLPLQQQAFDEAAFRH